MTRENRPAPQGENDLPGPGKHRLQLDLTMKALAQLDEIKQLAEVSSRAEAVRAALRFYRWFLEQRLEGSEIVLRKGGIEQTVHLLY